ncbi:MAG: NAD(P)-dependent oxidoreductase [Sphingomicrobium sp.]
MKSSTERIVITGAGGWIGMATLELLRNSLGPAAFQEHVRAFGSQDRTLLLRDGTVVEQRSLAELARLDNQPTILLHTAFLTKDRAEQMDEREYVEANEAIRATVLGALDRIGVDKLFVASSGAAGYADKPEASTAMRLYGAMKLDDERIFAQWASERSKMAVIARLFALSGPYINKPETYALAGFILDALAGRRILVRAPHPVVRGYVAIRELMSLVFALLMERDARVVHFETGGEAMELGDAAKIVSDALGGAGVDRAPAAGGVPDHYAGDDEAYRLLLKAADLHHVDFRQQVIETADFLIERASRDLPVAS